MGASAIRPYLPYTVATTLGGAKLGGLLALLAARTTIRHDIT